MKLKVGDVYWLAVTYPKTFEVETRPVVIYDFENDSPVIASFATITGSEIKDFDNKFDKWKSPIFGWKSSGLEKTSYVKANNIATIDAEIFKEKDYIGKLTDFDLKNALKKISDFIESGEVSW